MNAVQKPSGSLLTWSNLEGDGGSLQKHPKKMWCQQGGVSTTKNGSKVCFVNCKFQFTRKLSVAMNIKNNTIYILLSDFLSSKIENSLLLTGAP